MGRIANILDLPLDQKFLIASACLSVEFLLQLAVGRGETGEELMEQSLVFAKKQLWSGPEISEEKINSFLKEHFDSSDFTF
jgi:hypothetical protein